MYSWRHKADQVSMQLDGDQIVAWADAETAEPESSLDAARLSAWGMMGIPRNPDAAFFKAAKEKGLGAPLTTEFDFAWEEKSYRGQGFAMGIAYAEVGHWDKIMVVTWYT